MGRGAGRSALGLWSTLACLHCSLPQLPGSALKFRLTLTTAHEADSQPAEHGWDIRVTAPSGMPSMLLSLISVIVTLGVSQAHGQDKPCEYPEIKHGKLYRARRFRILFPVTVGQWYYYSCSGSYVTPTERYWDYITCTPDGWSPDVPCLRKCVFNYLENGHDPRYEQKYSQGQSVRVTCHPGYSLPNQRSTMTCTENGWSPPPKCIRVEHCDMPLFENATAIITGKVFRPNDTLDYQCLDGYETRDGHTKGSMVCGKDGWSHLPSCFKSAEKCGPPPAVSNGDITSFPLAAYPPGSRVEYKCQAYYELWGPKYATCIDAKWSKPPKCLVKPCELPEIKHGVLYEEQKNRPHFPVAVGQWYYYSCDNNYVTPSQTYWGTITCTPGGWSPDVPCLRKCVVNNLEHGRSPRYGETYLQGKTANLICHPGYSHESGQSIITCMENGWSSPLSCLKHCDMPLFENATAIITGKAFRPNDTLDYQCLDGYETRDGNTTGSLLCGEEGWSRLPSCFKSTEKCGPPPAVGNADITSFPLAAYPPGSRVEYQCQAYYELWGPNYVTCSDAKWSEPPKCLDPCVICEEILNKNNIQLKGKENKTYYAKTGEVIEFTCKSGHSAVTSGQSFQPMCREGIVKLPRCE
ncbi:complement factor H-related protein 4-like isoform X2 [Artibeus jamaicensis]|uniref:complement factor H-related protein 4-like isoform X2 n=1 Tax=Artibeus jamaicensis TaxID=9417 RepID=UPI00235A4832|nr:complement factor H-related protein 4-like isoform X2 [Artibeus jamaicensis]